VLPVVVGRALQAAGLYLWCTCRVPRVYPCRSWRCGACSCAWWSGACAAE